MTMSVYIHQEVFDFQAIRRVSVSKTQESSEETFSARMLKFYVMFRNF